MRIIASWFGSCRPAAYKYASVIIRQQRAPLGIDACEIGLSQSILSSPGRKHADTLNLVKEVTQCLEVSLDRMNPIQVQSPQHFRRHERTRSQGPFLRRRYPASSVIRPPIRFPLTSPSKTASRPLPSCQTGLPRLPASPFRRAVPTTPADRMGAFVDCFPIRAAFPVFCRRVGFRISTFGACSGFTHVTARRIAQPPKEAFVTRLRSSRLPDRTARQLPEQSTILWAESSSTGDPRLRGALRISRIRSKIRALI